MKNILKLILAVFALNSCVELPDLLPNGSGEDSDMVIYEYDAQVNDFEAWTAVVADDFLTFGFVDNEAEGVSCGDYILTVANGQVLNGNPLDGGSFGANGVSYLGLQEGALLGGTILGDWKNNIKILPLEASFGFEGCVFASAPFYYIQPDQDVILGIRIRNANGQWHYGWIVVYLQLEYLPPPFDLIPIKKLYVRMVGYNKLAGTNVRIGE